LAAILESDGLCKSFGRHAAIVDVSLRLFEGETFGFLGENGAGKSTFVQMICGVLPPDKGGISLFGRRATRVPAAWRAEIGYVAQEPRFDPWMSADELGLFLAPFFPTHDKVLYASLLKRLDVPVRQRIETLSVGQRARLAVAAALAHRPALLILDEPTAGLDPLARRELHELLKQTAAENPRATFFSSHIVDDVIHLATRVGVLDRGRLIYDGTPAALASSIRVIAAADRSHLPPLAAVLHSTADQLVVKAAPADWRTFAETMVFDATAVDVDANNSDVAVAPPAPRRLAAQALSFEDALLALLASRRAR